MRLAATPALAWVGLFCINALGILPWARIKFPIGDLAEMVYEANRLHLGYAPYRDTFTHHFLGYVIPLYVAGVVIPLTPFAIKVTTICFNFVTATLVWHILREVSSASAAWRGAFLTVTLGWFWSWQGFGFNVQSSLAPLIAGLLLGAVRACTRSCRSSLYGAAFFAGVLTICDQRAIVFVALPIVAWLYIPELRRRREAAVTVSCFVLAPLLGALYLCHAGAWNDFVAQTLVFPIQYRNHGVPFDLGAILTAWLGTWLGGERVAVPVMLAGLIAALAFEPRRPLQVLWLASVICAALYAGLGGRPFPNYFLVFAPITLVLMNLFPHYMASRWPVAGRAAASAVLVLGVACGIRPFALWSNTGSIFLPSNEDTIDSVADYLRTHTSAEDGVLVWGFAPQIYILSGRFRTFKDAGLLSIAGANFKSSDAAAQRLVPEMVHEFDNYLASNPPQAIVVYRITREPCSGGIIQHNLDYHRNSSLTNLRNLLASSYRSELIVEGSCDRAEIFLHAGSR